MIVCLTQFADQQKERTSLNRGFKTEFEIGADNPGFERPVPGLKIWRNLRNVWSN